MGPDKVIVVGVTLLYDIFIFQFLILMLGIVIGAVASAGILILLNKDPAAVKQLKE